MNQNFDREFEALVAAFYAEATGQEPTRTGASGTDDATHPSDESHRSGSAPATAASSLRRHRRRDPLPTHYTYQLRINLRDATPPIWRRLEVSSKLNLHRLHLAIQGAFDWYNSHLYRFSLGNPFAYDSELFLCEFDVAEGEDEGCPALEVRLDETLQQVGDALSYVYDYGDNWDLKIRLEAVLDRNHETRDAVCTGGRRAAPPEDCGSLRDERSLARVLPDPAFFDVDETNLLIGAFLDRTLEDPFGVPNWETVPEWQRHPAFRAILQNTQNPLERADLLQRLRLLEQTAETLETRFTAQDTEAAVSAVTELLKMLGDGVRLTKAGYLPPAIAHAFARGLLPDADHRHIRGSEAHQRQPLEFRTYLQKVGLVRKYRGVLLPTKVGTAAATSPSALWEHLVQRIAPLPRAALGDRDFATEAALLTLLSAATVEDARLPIDLIADQLTEAGWSAEDDTPISYFDVAWNGANPAVLLWFMGPREGRGWGVSLSESARLLAQAALLRLSLDE